MVHSRVPFFKVLVELDDVSSEGLEELAVVLVEVEFLDVLGHICL